MLERIKNGEFKNIIVVTGAGVSTNAGIADYRSETGLFKELIKEFNIEPYQLFTKSFMDKLTNNTVYKNQLKLIEQAIPTPTHYFCKYLYDKGWLKRVYTQNIDSLHQKAGLPEDVVVEYHGSLKKNVVLYGDKIDENVIKQTIIDFNEVDFSVSHGDKFTGCSILCLTEFGI
jgi:NAD+-dependent protein deacetylase sirtuin 2